MRTAASVRRLSRLATSLLSRESIKPSPRPALCPVAGPLADHADLYHSDYAGAGTPANSPSIADALFALNAQHGGSTTRADGVGVTCRSRTRPCKANASEVGAALELVKAADATVIVRPPPAPPPSPLRPPPGRHDAVVTDPAHHPIQSNPIQSNRG